MKLNMVARALSLALAVGAMALVATPASALDRETARTLVKERGDAVITLEVVLEEKFSFRGQQNERENKQETIGVVMDESGLVATSLSNIDPGQVFARFSEEEDSYTTSLKSLKYILTDGTEIDAGVVLRDPDLDLVFLRPLEAPAAKLTALPLDNVAQAGVLDEVFSIERSGRITRRTVIAKTGEIVAVVDRPRLLYVPSVDLVTNRTGAPVFAADGRLVGMTSVHVFPGGRKTMGDNDQPYIYVIRPAAEILSIAKQAPEKVTEVPAGASDDADTTGSQSAEPGS